MTLQHNWRIIVGPATLVFAVLLATACQSAPAAPQAAAPAPSTAKLLLMSDMVQGSKNVPQNQMAQRACVLSSRFARNSEVVFRARIFDPATGDPMDDKAVSKVEVKLSNGNILDMKYGLHPKEPPQEGFWTTSFVVPKDSPTGSFKYTILATDIKGRTGLFAPFISPSSLPAITAEVLPDAPAKPGS